MTLSEEQMRLFLSFVVGRHVVYLRRKQGVPKPWTEDPILRQYRFCNIYRELDTTTMWIRKNFGDKRSPDLWFAMVLARFINRVDTLKMLPNPTVWDPRKFIKAMDEAQARNGTVFGGAYMIRPDRHGRAKIPYLADEVFGPLWAAREQLRPRPGQTLAGYHHQLCQFHDMGSFMAAQVVADLKNEDTCWLSKAPDWWVWAAPGPGSLRGLNRLRGRPAVKTGYRTGEWLRGVNQLRDYINDRIVTAGWEHLCAHDLQNCLCEFEKYERVRLGEGTPKQRYPGEAP